LARSKYKSEKRQKEIARGKKKEEKRQRRLNKGVVKPEEDADPSKGEAQPSEAEPS
jgi:hypothetical protein